MDFCSDVLDDLIALVKTVDWNFDLIKNDSLSVLLAVVDQDHFEEYKLKELVRQAKWAKLSLVFVLDSVLNEDTLTAFTALKIKYVYLHTATEVAFKQLLTSSSLDLTDLYRSRGKFKILGQSFNIEVTFPSKVSFDFEGVFDFRYYVLDPKAFAFSHTSSVDFYDCSKNMSKAIGNKLVLSSFEDIDGKRSVFGLSQANGMIIKAIPLS